MWKLASWLADALDTFGHWLAWRNSDPAERRRSTFVRRRGDDIEVAEVVEFTDGTAMVFEGEYAEGLGVFSDYRHSPSARREVRRNLPQAGYVELTDALRSGLLTKDQADELLA